MRIFFIESVNPIDLLQGRSESRGLSEICKIIGHETAVLTAYDKNDLHKLCGYISSIESDEKDTIPLCIHLSTHGNEDVLGFGKDDVDWEKVFNAMKPIFSEMGNYNGKVILAISACEAGKQKLTNEIEKEQKENKKFIPPKYIFVTNDEEVLWDDAIVSWSMFYHQLPKAKLDSPNSVRLILDRIKFSGTGNLKYFRWHKGEERYKYYLAKPK